MNKLPHGTYSTRQERYTQCGNSMSTATNISWTRTT